VLCKRYIYICVIRFVKRDLHASKKHVQKRLTDYVCRPARTSTPGKGGGLYGTTRNEKKTHVDSLGVLSIFVDVPAPVPRARVEGYMALRETKKKHMLIV